MLNWTENSNMRPAQCFARLRDPGCVGVEWSRYFWEGKGKRLNQREDRTTGGSTGQPGDSHQDKRRRGSSQQKAPEQLVK